MHALNKNQDIFYDKKSGKILVSPWGESKATKRSFQWQTKGKSQENHHHQSLISIESKVERKKGLSELLCWQKS